MNEEEPLDDDSRLLSGGSVPGNPGVPAYTLRTREPSPIPVLIAVPHAGRAYATGLLDRMRNPAFAVPRLEDRYVDLLAKAVARQTGAALLVANAPRAMIDLNRDTDDVDWDMLDQPPPDATGQSPAGLAGRALGVARRARNGLGLIPRRLPGLGELWNRRMEQSELDARISAIHTPYHAALSDALAVLRGRWGAALLIDLHSMPPLSARYSGELPAEFVVGDRFGLSCEGALVGATFGYFTRNGRRAAHNRPYAGGYVLARHAAPRKGIHCLQLEIDRQCYLDSRLSEPSDGFAPMVATLTGLVRELAADVAALGGGVKNPESANEDETRWRDAAE